MSHETSRTSYPVDARDKVDQLRARAYFRLQYQQQFNVSPDWSIRLQNYTSPRAREAWRIWQDEHSNFFIHDDEIDVTAQ